MNTTTTTTTASTVTASTVKKQYTFGVSEAHKTEIGELRQDFTRPAAVKNAPAVPMSEKEALEILWIVATDRRYKTTELLDEAGNAVLDSDGLPEFQTIDLFEQEWEKIKVRDYSETITKTPTIAGLEAQIRKYGKALNLTEESIMQMIESAKAGQVA